MTSPTELLASETWNTELTARPKADIDWVWPGYLAHGAVTLLTSQAKTGKTTLISALIAKMARGGELAGLTGRPARVAVVSEEPLDYWQRRGEKLGFGDELCFFCRPFTSQPSLAAWEALVDRLGELGRQRGIDVVIFDPLAPLLPPGAESQTSLMLQVLTCLTRLTRQGQAVLVLHHPTKGAVKAGQLARGCGALGASVDILMEMSLVASALETDRRRRIAA
jgi:RecA-family ATPase